MIVTNHLKTLRKLHAWRTGSDRVLKRSASITCKLDIPMGSWYRSIFHRRWFASAWCMCFARAPVDYNWSVTDTNSALACCMCFARAHVDYSWSVKETSSASIIVAQTLCIGADSPITTLTWLRIRDVVQFHTIVLVIRYLPLHLPEMNVFKPRRIDGDHSAIAFILVCLFVSLLLVQHRLWWGTSSRVGLYNAKMCIEIGRLWLWII